VTTEVLPAVIEPVRVDLGVIRADKPAELVKFAAEAANALAGVIESRKLFSTISGRRYVRCEGWTTLAAMLGVTPHEIGVTEVDGSFTATVELRRLTDGQPVSRASAECGTDEPTWKARARYARRSMALTRATAKACRLAFSWVMALSGYEVTPAEEIPDERGGASPRGSGTAPKEPVAPTPQPLTEKPAALTKPEPMPWDGKAPAWKGKPLKEFKSKDLVTLRNFCEKKNPTEYATLMQQIDDELAGRQGE